MKKFIRKRRTLFDQKGFNLFSSIVAAVLVMASVILVNTLISTEEKTNSQVYTMINSFELSDAASLARADALQSFNYNFREKMEDFLSCQCPACVCSGGQDEAKYFPILNMNNYDDWDSMETAFEHVVLLTDANTRANFETTIKYVADKTIDQFDNRSYGRYNVYLSDTSETAKNALREGMTRVLDDAVLDNKKFIEVVDCDGSNCPLGTFYFNIPLNRLEDYPELYEKLPRIVVRDTISEEEMKVAILPKSNLRIYIPLRFFKAIFEARKQAEAIASAENDLEEARLGFCDGGCIPRTDPMDSAPSGNWNKECPGQATAVTQDLLGTNLVGIKLYYPGGSQGPANGLQAVARSIICDATISAGVGNVAENGFGNYNYQVGLKPRLGGDVVVPGCPYQDIIATPKSYETKQIEGSPTKLYCMQILGTQAYVIYEEVNSLYLVSGEKNFYKIQISTTHPEDSGGVNGTCSNGLANTCVAK